MDPGLEYSLGPADDDLSRWTAQIRVADRDCVFQGLPLQLQLALPDSYPLRPPTVRFCGRVAHPNVDASTGRVCMDVLEQAHWTPAWTLIQVVEAVIQLLKQPEPDSPLNVDVANLVRAGDLTAWRSLARYHAQQQ